MLRHPIFAGSGGCRFEVLRQLRCRMHVHLQLLHFDEQLRDLHHKVCRRDGKGVRTWATRMPKKKKRWTIYQVGGFPLSVPRMGDYHQPQLLAVTSCSFPPLMSTLVRMW